MNVEEKTKGVRFAVYEVKDTLDEVMDGLKEGFKGNIKVLEGLKKVDVAVKDLQRVGTDLITKRRSEMNLEMIVKFAQGKVEQAGNGWVEKDEHGEWVDCTEQVNAPSPSDAALSRYLRMVGGARLLGRRV